MAIVAGAAEGVWPTGEGRGRFGAGAGLRWELRCPTTHATGNSTTNINNNATSATSVKGAISREWSCRSRSR